jgi:hypothetical protein
MGDDRQALTRPAEPKLVLANSLDDMRDGEVVVIEASGRVQSKARRRWTTEWLAAWAPAATTR